MKQRTFMDLGGDTLTIRHRKDAVYFYREPKSVERNGKRIDFSQRYRTYRFDKKTERELFLYLMAAGHQAWKSFSISDNEGSVMDYSEYYDKEFNSDGYLRIRDQGITIEGPVQPFHPQMGLRMFKFTRRKFESFMYELQKRRTYSIGLNEKAFS